MFGGKPTGFNKEDEITQMLIRMSNNSSTENNKVIFETWKEENPDKIERYKELENLWCELGLYAEEIPENVCNKHIDEALSEKQKSIKFLAAYAAAACIVIISALSSIRKPYPR